MARRSCLLVHNSDRPAGAAAADADMILHGGKVVTADKRSPSPEAVAIKDGRIVAVGTSPDVLARERGAKTQVIDLKGAACCRA